MNKPSQQEISLNINSEYGVLNSVLMHDASNLPDAEEAVAFLHNKGLLQAVLDQYASHPESEMSGDIEAALEDPSSLYDAHEVRYLIACLMDTVESREATIYNPEAVPGSMSQFFTRDSGFVVGDTFIQSRMANPLRVNEYAGLINLRSRFANSAQIESGSIEGGDVFVDKGKVYVGISERTNIDGFNNLARIIQPKGFECIPIEYGKGIVHLDCIFNIIGEELAIADTRKLEKDALQALQQNFEIIDIPASGKPEIGLNIFPLSPKEIVADKRGDVGNILRSRGFNVIGINNSEITKFLGSFRCTTLPLYRENI